ncbi:MAG: hypothetical protein JNK63_07890 [Chthonomonas sp.]|nr:hypothetical protein [Chthonomonas sp.]
MKWRPKKSAWHWAGLYFSLVGVGVMVGSPANFWGRGALFALLLVIAAPSFRDLYYEARLAEEKEANHD